MRRLDSNRRPSRGRGESSPSSGAAPQPSCFGTTKRSVRHRPWTTGAKVVFARVSVESAAVGNFASAARARRRPSEVQGEVLQPGVVPDQHHGGDCLGNERGCGRAAVGRSCVQLVLQAHRRVLRARTEAARASPASARRRSRARARARSQPGKVLGDPLRISPASRRERTLLVGELGRPSWISRAGEGRGCASPAWFGLDAHGPARSVLSEGTKKPPACWCRWVRAGGCRASAGRRPSSNG